MKIQIDTDKKVLRLESDVNLGEFIEKVKVLFPKGEWKEFSLETNVEIQWTNPIYIDRWTYPTYPWWYPSPTITYGTTSQDVKDGSFKEWINDGYLQSSEAKALGEQLVYNVEV